MKILTFFLLFGFSFLFAQNQAPLVQNLQARVDPNTFVLTVDFDLSDAEGDSLKVYLRLSDDAGVHFGGKVNAATGDLGFPVLPGTGKQIQLPLPGPIPTPLYRVRVIADDGQTPEVQNLVDQVDSLRLWQDLGFFSQMRHYLLQVAQNEWIKDSLEARFAAAGLATSRQGGLYQGYQAENIIGRQGGLLEDSLTYAVSAHFDPVAGTPGADDNASGVVGMLEVSRILSAYSLVRSVNYIGFDLEEEGLVGSDFYVNQGGIRPHELIQGVLNYDMIGFASDSPNTQTPPPGFDLLYPQQFQALAADSFRGNFITNISLAAFDPWRQTFDSCAAIYVPDLRVISLPAPSNPLLAPDFWRGDHAQFWLAGIPTVFLTDGAEFRNPNYHTAGDSIGTLNLGFLTRVVKASIATLAQSAGLMHAGQATATPSVSTSLTPTGTCAFSLSRTATHYQLRRVACNQSTWELHLLDLSGRMVKHFRLKAGQQVLALSLADLPRGVYLLVGEGPEGSWRGKLIR